MQHVEPGLEAGELEVRGVQLIAGNADFVLAEQEGGFQPGDSVVETLGGRFWHEPDWGHRRVGERTMERLGPRRWGRQLEWLGDAWADAQVAGEAHAVEHGLDGGSRLHWGVK